MNESIESPFALEEYGRMLGEPDSNGGGVPAENYLAGHQANFLTLMGFNWPGKKDSIFSATLKYTWNMMVRISLLTYSFEGIIVLWACIDSTLVDVAFGAVFGTILIIQSLVLVPIFLATSRRLRDAQVRQGDFKHYEVCSREALFVFGVMCVFGFILPIEMSIYYFRDDSFAGVVLYISTYWTILASACTVAGNVFFGLVDIRVSLQLVRGLAEKHRSRTLAMKEFNDVRDEVERRVESFKHTNNAILFLALLDVTIGLIILLLYSNQYHILVIIALIFSLLKELPYVLIMFLRSAEINGCVDELTQQLGTVEWDTGSSGEYSAQEMLRLKLFANAQARVISYPMGGMRLKVRTVFFQVCWFVVLFAVGLVKSIIYSFIG